MKIIAPFIIWLAAVPAFNPRLVANEEQICVSEEEKKLYALIMEYRKSKKLKKIPLSAKLMKTAQIHARDLGDNYTWEPGAECNPHSWSDKGNWTSCCYTSDHKQAECMWIKPKEIAGYDSRGYEIAYYDSRNGTAEEALKGWKKSPGHNSLIVNLGTWKDVEWKAIGIGFYKEYGVVWFGEMEDDEKPKECK